MPQKHWAMSPYRPDPWPYSLVIETQAGQVFGFLVNPKSAWQATQMNQKATRFSTGDRDITQMTLANTQTWKDLHAGGVGARETSDASRYRHAVNVMPGDEGELKLAPEYTLLPNFLDPGEVIVKMLTWPGPKVSGRAAGVGDELVVLVIARPASHASGRRTRLMQLNSTTLAVTDVTLYAGGTAITSFTETALDACLHKNRLYLALDPTGPGPQVRFVDWDAGNSRFRIGDVTANTSGPVTRELLYSDGDFLFGVLGNEVFRSSDPVRALNPASGSTPAETSVWSGAVPVGNGGPVTGLVTYGADNEQALYIRTWEGLYRATEETDKDGNKLIKRAYPSDIRPGTASNSRGLFVVNNEIVWFGPRGLFRHTLGQTSIASPNEDNGFPDTEVGEASCLQDGSGGIYLGWNPNTSAGRPAVYRWQAGRFHSFLTFTDSEVTSVTGLAWTTRQVAASARLWIMLTKNGQQRLGYINLPSNTTNYRLLSSTTYPYSGTIEFPVFRGEFGLLEKLWMSTRLTGLIPATVGTGSVEVAWTNDIESQAPAFEDVGVFTNVPGKTPRWVAAKRGHYQPFEAPLARNSLGMRLRLTLKRTLGAAYPDTGMTDVRGVIIRPTNPFAQELVVWGKVANPHAPTTSLLPAGNSALLRWSSSAGWRRANIFASVINDVKTDTDGRVIIAGQILQDDAFYGVAVWNPDDDTVTTWIGSKNLTGRLLIDHPTGIAVILQDSINQGVLCKRDPGAWHHQAISELCPRAALTLSDGTILLVGTGTTISRGGVAYTIPADMARVSFDAPAPITITPSISTPQRNSLNHVALFGGLLYWAGGTGSDSLIYTTPQHPAGAVTFTPVTNVGISAPGPVTGLRTTHAKLGIGLASGGVFEYTGSAWTVQQIAAGLPASGAVTSFAATDQTGMYVIGDFNTGMNMYDSAAPGTGASPLVAMQVIYVPTGASPTVVKTPVVTAVGVDFIEMPPFLRSYVITVEASDDERLLDGSGHPLSAQGQLTALMTLATEQQLVRVILPDFTHMYGFIGGLRWQQTKIERGNQVAAPARLGYKITFTLTEAVPQIASEPAPYPE